LGNRLQNCLIDNSRSGNGNNESNTGQPEIPTKEIKSEKIDEIDLQSIRKMRESFFKQKEEKQTVPGTSAMETTGSSFPAPHTTGGKSHSQLKSASDYLLRVSFAKLDHLYNFSEELLTSKIRFEQISKEVLDPLAKLAHLRKEWRYYDTKLNLFRSRLLNSSNNLTKEEQVLLQQFSDFIEWHNGYLAKIESRLLAIQKVTNSETKTLHSQVEGILGTLREILILPFSHLTDMLPKMTRDIAHELGKEVELQIRGAEIEIEKRILDEFRDPLIHLIRNAIDHGIESTKQRVKAGKPARGKITLAITQTDAARVMIEIYDDGSGLQVESLKKSAIKRNILQASDAARQTEEEAFDLIFRSGVTTSPVITDISGRGLGMAIVKEKIEKLNGSIVISSRPGEGTRFKILLPVTIAAQRAITIRCNDRIFLLPATYLQKVLRLRPEQIQMIEGKPSCILERNSVPIINLSDVLHLGKTDEPERRFVLIAILLQNEEKIAFAFDELLDEQEIVIKPFNKQIRKIKNIAGANLTADGHIIPILDANDLMRSAREHLTGESAAVAPPRKELNRQQHILVADDSITSRMLMKDILESAGYLVTTAIDGVDAMTQLRTKDFNLVVSDVEMPRLNGFELTASIRANQKTAELPVILVTGLSKREDKEKGIDAGANAYVVKSSFDQTNLLEIIERLIV
jgi:two-component system chemotaxis sensor kinase CheA